MDGEPVSELGPQPRPPPAVSLRFQGAARRLFSTVSIGRSSRNISTVVLHSFSTTTAVPRTDGSEWRAPFLASAHRMWFRGLRCARFLASSFHSEITTTPCSYSPLYLGSVKSQCSRSSAHGQPERRRTRRANPIGGEARGACTLHDSTTYVVFASIEVNWEHIELVNGLVWNSLRAPRTAASTASRCLVDQRGAYATG